MTTKNTTKKKKVVMEGKSLTDRVKDATKKESKIYDDRGVNRQIFINFPKKQRVPLIGKIGIKLVQMSGGILDIKYIDLREEK